MATGLVHDRDELKQHQIFSAATDETLEYQESTSVVARQRRRDHWVLPSEPPKRDTAAGRAP
jgi:hypothetical protein